MERPSRRGILVALGSAGVKSATAAAMTRASGAGARRWLRAVDDRPDRAAPQLRRRLDADDLGLGGKRDLDRGGDQGHGGAAGQRRVG